MLYLRNNNKLLEFSATIDMGDKTISQKYSDKIIYKYDLGQFMNDGYSKNVLRLQATDSDEMKMKDVILLSQFRKLIARDNGIDYFKPIVMFKSSKIKISETKQQEFNSIIENLSVEELTRYIKQRKSSVVPNSTLDIVFAYYLEEDLDSIIREIQEDFEPRNILNANEKNMLSVDNAVLLNSLENVNNPIRVIFAVAKLNEGWDVLNLYDIVRISEGAGTTRTATDSEAQLVGRGARYYPYEYNEQRTYTRRFDNTNNDLRFLETLHYHTINEKGYLANLEKSMNAVNLITANDETVLKLSTRIKSAFKKTKVFKQGQLFVNESRPTTPEDYSSLGKFTIPKEWVTEYIGSTVEVKFQEKENLQSVERHEQALDVDKRFFKKGIQRNPFYRFSNIRKYLPMLKSINELLTSEKYFKGVSITVSLPKEQHITELSSKEKLDIVDRFLSYCEDKIRRNYKKEIGLKVFKPVAIKDTLKDYEVVVPKFETGQHVTQRIDIHSMKGKDWFVYTDVIMNNLEYNMVELMENFIHQLQLKYEDIYLIRNDEKAIRFKLTEFNGPRGFMPDFILYLSNEDFVYQIYMEPKGEDREKDDAWKEEMLEEINGSDIEIIGETDLVKLMGVKFYNKKNRRRFIDELSERINDGEPLDGKIELLGEE